MSFFGRLTNNLRNSLGLDTTADALDRKINSMNVKEQKDLELQKKMNDIELEKYKYEEFLPQETLNEIEKILNNIDEIMKLSEIDITKPDSGMISTVDGYTGNISSLYTYLAIIEKKLDFQMVSKIRQEIEKNKKDVIKRYINNIIFLLPQDNGETIENDKIFNLYIITQKSASLVNINSNLKGYEWLEDIYKKSMEEKTKLDMQLANIYTLQRPYKNENAMINYHLQAIESQRQKLRTTKEYLIKDADRKAMKR